MIELIIGLIVIGVALYLLDLIPMDGTIKTIIRVVVILLAVLYVLQFFGIWHGMPRLRG